MPVVLDASMALAWAFRDERDRRAERALEVVSDQGALVPAFWAYEIANGVYRGQRLGRIGTDDHVEFMAALTTLELEVVELPREQIFGRVSSLAFRYDLSVYDASYLELAMREGLPLATLDRALGAAARRAGVELLEA